MRARGKAVGLLLSSLTRLPATPEMRFWCRCVETNLQSIKLLQSSAKKDASSSPCNSSLPLPSSLSRPHRDVQHVAASR